MGEMNSMGGARPKRRIGALVFFKSYNAFLEAVERAKKIYSNHLVPLDCPSHLTIDIYSTPWDNPIKTIIWGEARDEAAFEEFIFRLFERRPKEVIRVRPEELPRKSIHIGHQRLDAYLG